MALVKRQDLSRRYDRILREYALDVINETALGARNIAHAAAERSPTDTTRLASNFLIGRSQFDFTYRRAWIEGKKNPATGVSSTRLGSIARLNIHNERVARREVSRVKALRRLPNVWRISVQNHTPYLPFVERRRPYLEAATASAIRRARAAYESVRVQEF